MEIVLEHAEVIRLLRKGLAAEHIVVPSNAKVTVRRNNKKGTIRVVFKSEP
jgi:hypothetical protein